MANSTPQNYKIPSTSKVSVDKLLRVGYYELEKTIGKGNFAVVKLASNIVTKSKVAIKIIDKTCLNEEYLAKTFREISILKSMQHQHITRLYEVMESASMIYLVTEYAPNGEIFDHLVEHGRMKEPEAARVFKQLISAVQYCHLKGVVHRDLKAENVLLDEDMNIKLADFGFSNRYEQGSPLTTWCGSPPYAAPEVFLGLKYDGPKVDIWSLGVVLYALVCGALPFDGQTLLELKSRVVIGKFRIPYFMSRDCENIIRNMLVVEPERRYTLNQIIKHRWLNSVELAEAENNANKYAIHSNAGNPLLRSSSNTSCSINPASETGSSNIDTVVMTHMLQLPSLTEEMITQSVQGKRFDNIYAIYHLLYDKLQKKRRDHQRMQPHVNMSISRSRKTSITTGVVDRSELVKQESIDRLSPLTNANSSNNALGFQWTDVSVDLEKFGDIELECLSRQSNTQSNNQNHLSANASGANGANIRRHTVGPGDVAHEQALANPNVPPIDFKCTPDQQYVPGQYLPINLPMLQNQPLHSLTIKDQHLLKPPMVMGASSFGRRASDGGANLHIYYPSTPMAPQAQPLEASPYYINQNTHASPIATTAISETSELSHTTPLHEAMLMVPQNQMNEISTTELPQRDEGCEEIQRYMQKRGCVKRHTVGCTDDLTVTQHVAYDPSDNLNGTTAQQIGAVCSISGSNACATIGVNTGGGMRTRRTGLLTVTERPPVISPEVIREVESRMNRNYLPPALKLPQNMNNPPILSQSPPSSTIFSALTSSPNSNNILHTQTITTPTLPITTSNAAANCRRIYARACNKLPTVQEVGRYSPVRRASEGSKTQFQGPLQECQYLQKGIAQRNLLVAPSPPLLENSISLPGSPIHGKPASYLMFRRGQDIEVPPDAIKSLLPLLDRYVKEHRISIETANNIISGVVPIDLAPHLGLIAHSSNATSGGHLDLSHMQQQQMYSYSASPLSLANSGCSATTDAGVSNISACGAISGPLVSPTTQACVGMGTHSKLMLCAQSIYHSQPQQQQQQQQQQQHQHQFYAGTQPNSGLIGQFSNINLNTNVSQGSNSSSGCHSPVYGSFSGSSSPNPYIPGTGMFNAISAAGGTGGGSSPMHQITKGISGLTAGGSITRGTSAASEIITINSMSNQPLDLSMDVCITDTTIDSFAQQNTQLNWYLPSSSVYDLKPLNLSPAQTIRIVPTPPASPNLCIIQEENAHGQMCHTISTGTPYTGCTGGLINEDITSPCQPSHPQICLTDVQGSEITLVALSSENSHDSDCDSTEAQTPVMSLQSLIITEPSSDMPSITRGIGRKTSLECEGNSVRSETEQHEYNTNTTATNTDANRRGSDKSLGFSDDSLSNDSNNLSPCQEPSASSGFKSDSHSEVGDHTEAGHLTPDSMCDSRRMSDEMCFEVPLPHECSNLDSTRILEMVKQTIDSTMPPKGFALRKGSICDESSYASADSYRFSNTMNPTEVKSSFLVDPHPAAMNLSLEYSGGLQIELQVCEGRSRDNQSAGKGIKLRRISGDQFEYGKLCQQLISTITMQQVAG